MAGGAASESILFIGSMVAAAAIAGVLGVVVQELSGGIQDRGSSLSRELGTSIIVINDPQAVATSPLTVYAKNTGGSTLTSSLTNLFLDGTPSSSPGYDVLASTADERWTPGSVLQITATDLTVAAGDHHVRVVAETGIGADLLFHKS